MKISVVIPVYGCRAALPELYRRVSEAVKTITDDYELILVNDNCPQNSWEVIEGLCGRDKHVVGIELARNFGQMKAILAGMDNADGDWVVVMDCDLQDKPEEIPNLYNKAIEGYDAVFARRKDRKDGWFKKFQSAMYYKVYRYATDSDFDGDVCNFSIISRQVKDEYCKLRELHRGYLEYINWIGFRKAIIDVEHCERYEGKSAYDFKRKMEMALELLTSQSNKILKLFVKTGFLFTVLSAIAAVVLIVKYFVTHVTEGWTSIIVLNLLIGGVLMTALGIVGLYVGNIFMQVKERPLYVVRQIKNKD